MSEDFFEELSLEQSEISDSKILGKFATVSELEKAYESLQSEFTRKSQLLAELQQGNAVAAIKEPVVEVEPPVACCDTPLQQGGTTREEIIREYLTSVAARPTAPAVITGTSAPAFGIKPEPRALRDVERLAENYFKLKEK